MTTLERTDRVEPRAEVPAPEYVEVIVAVKDGDRIHTYMGRADEVTFWTDAYYSNLYAEHSLKVSFVGEVVHQERGAHE